jgi:hypothetical protein
VLPQLRADETGVDAEMATNAFTGKNPAVSCGKKPSLGITELALPSRTLGASMADKTLYGVFENHRHQPQLSFGDRRAIAGA